MTTTIKMSSKLADMINCGEIANNLIIVLLGSLFLAIAAQVSLPIHPVPITLQSSAALFVSMIFGARTGAKIIIAYLIEGLCGLPVFANFSFGPQILFGPTGGYLIGFIPAAILTGYLLQSGWAKYRITTFLTALLGTLVLFTTGYLVLAYFIGFHNAYLFGVVPFYATESCKLVFLTISVPYFWHTKTQ